DVCTEYNVQTRWQEFSSMMSAVATIEHCTACQCVPWSTNAQTACCNFRHHYRCSTKGRCQHGNLIEMRDETLAAPGGYRDPPFCVPSASPAPFPAASPGQKDRKK